MVLLIVEDAQPFTDCILSANRIAKRAFSFLSSRAVVFFDRDEEIVQQVLALAICIKDTFLVGKQTLESR